jgi:hypothetical protein
MVVRISFSSSNSSPS